MYRAQIKTHVVSQRIVLTNIYLRALLTLLQHCK